MHTIRANGQTSRTKHDPLDVARGIAAYVAGQPATDAAGGTSIPHSTLSNILRKHGLIRSHLEASCQRVAREEDRPTPVARQRIIEREYTPVKSYLNQEELAERFGVSESTITKDRSAIGYTLCRSLRRSLARWGSKRSYLEHQRKAALLRKKGYTYKEICRELGCSMPTARRLVRKFRERKSD
jgi:transposase-like protein